VEIESAWSTKTQASGGTPLCSRRTAPLKPKSGLNGPPASSDLIRVPFCVMLKGERERAQRPMIRAHVNKMGIVMRFDSMADNLSSARWTTLLDELKSHYIPSFYQDGKRLHVDMSAEGKLRAVVYFTPQTVTIDEAIRILKRWGMEVHDVRENPTGE
jgi:hypothetical protein